MFNRITDFVTKKEILNDNQYGFREQRSTYMALDQLLDKVLLQILSGMCLMLVF